jgi:UDP-N-acetyl-D-mannosaminuronate dehydrogenase
MSTVAVVGLGYVGLPLVIEFGKHFPTIGFDIEEYGTALCEWSDLPRADAVVAAVAHRQYQELTPAQIADKAVPGGCFIDVKSCFDAAALRRAGLSVWRL